MSVPVAVSAGFRQLSGGAALLSDSFGVAKVAQSYPVFASMSCRGSNVLGMDQTANVGTAPPGIPVVNTSWVTFSNSGATASTYQLSATRIDGAAPISAARQSYVYTSYTPGVGKQALFTGVLRSGGGPTVTGPLQAYARVGLFDGTSGLFWQYDPYLSTVSVNIKSPAGGIVSASQADFNGNNLQAVTVPAVTGDGSTTEPINWSKYQLFYIDYEWLGAGAVRFGIIVNGTLLIAHTFSHYNTNTEPYMPIPNVPARYEVAVTAAATGTMDMIEGCCSVTVTAKPLIPSIVMTTLAYTSSGVNTTAWPGAETPVLAIRGQLAPSPSSADGVWSAITLAQVSIALSTNDTVVLRVYRCFNQAGVQYGTVTSTGPGPDASNPGFVNPYTLMPSADPTAPSCLVEVCDPSIAGTTLSLGNKTHAQLLASAAATVQTRFGVSAGVAVLGVSLPIGTPTAKPVPTVFVITAQKYNTTTPTWGGVCNLSWNQES